MQKTITAECKERIEQKLKYQNERREERRKKLGVEENVLTEKRLDLELKREIDAIDSDWFGDIE